MLHAGNSFCSVNEKLLFSTLNGFETILFAMQDSIPHTEDLEVYCRAIANAIANCPANKVAFAQQGIGPLCPPSCSFLFYFTFLAKLVIANCPRDKVAFAQ